jgi:TatD DNase family protein
MKPFLIDSHCHLQFNAFNQDRLEVINRMRQENINGIIIGGNYEESQQAIALAEKENFFASIGLHPIHVEEINDNSQGVVKAEKFEKEKFIEFLKNPIVKAIGECGLDYFHLQDENKKQEQKNIFQAQIDLAKEFKKPLILHIRDKGDFSSYQDILDILQEKKCFGENIGVVHFFSANWEIAQKFLDLGFYLSFTGVITFTHQYDEIIKNTPVERLLVETDSPYVAPEPFRGKRCEPIYVEYVAQRIAEIKEVSLEEVAKQTTENCIKLFNLKQKVENRK